MSRSALQEAYQLSRNKPSPPKEELLAFSSVNSIVKHYVTNHYTANKWLLKNSISLKDARIYPLPEGFSDYCKSHNRTEVSKKFNLSYSGVLGMCKRHSIDPPLKLSDTWKYNVNQVIEKLEDIRRLNHDECLSISEIKDRLNIEASPTAILNIMHENDIQPRSSFGWKSAGEDELIAFIKSLSVKCEKQKFKTSDGWREIDAYCPDQKIGFEYNGLFWHSTENLGKYYHRDKRRAISTLDIKLVNLLESEWILKRPQCESMIRSKLGISTHKIMARKCVIDLNVSSIEAREHFDNTHLAGHINSSVYIGLRYKGELVACASFMRSRFSTGWELARMSFALDTNIVGGTSRLIKSFMKLHSPCRLLTYVDLRYGDGSSYEKSGMTRLKDTPPNYKYFKKGSLELHNRMKFQKSKLFELLGEKFDSNLTESENMSSAGYLSIHDCGNATYELA